MSGSAVRSASVWRGLFRVTVLSLLTLASLHSTPAFSEGYNDGGYNFTEGASSTTLGNAGIYVREPQTADQIASHSGPHGGYTTSTNKCADCHSTHYAVGSFVLTRADSRETVCDFCHAGGGGSNTNIQLDNHYGTESVVATTTMGIGTGHTLGFTGLSAADVNPSYRSDLGFSCFDCHTPHGNADRVMTTFQDPGREMGGVITGTTQTEVLVTRVYDAGGLVYEDLSGQTDLIAWYSAEGMTESLYAEETFKGNLVVIADGVVHPEPIWPTGRFLLLKNPHQEAYDDTVVGVHPGSGIDAGTNKWPVDWENPIGLGFHDEALDGDPADGDPSDDALRYLTMSEFCMDCHDGAVGASTHVSYSWMPNESDTTTGTYADIYHHDSNPRLRDDQMYLMPGGTADNPDGTLNNYGNHCRKCHIGGSSCNQCHGMDADGDMMSAYDRLLTPYDPHSDHDDYTTTYWAQPYVHRSAVASVSVAGIGVQCIDGGFSWPHRTLAVNLLKDEMFGIDFDGSPIEPGDIRMTSGQVESYLGLEAGGYLAAPAEASEVATVTWRPSPDDTLGIFGQPAENADSMCLDCHGDATYWNGDNPDYFTPGKGWELLLKGLN